MSTDPHATDAPGHTTPADGDHHSPNDHGDDHGHDDHAHTEVALGPIDVAAWGAGVAGIAIALALAFCFALTTGSLG